MRIFHILLALLVVLPLSCSDGEQAQVWQARSAFTAGDVDGAEKLIAGCTGDEARKLRDEITMLRATRTEIDSECQRIETRTSMATLDSDRATLLNLLTRTNDLKARARVDAALAKLPVVAQQRVAAEKAKAEAEVQEQMAAAAAAETTRKSTVLNDIRRCIAKREWGQGLDLLKQAVDGQTAEAADLDQLRKELLKSAESEISDLIARAATAEREQSSKAAYEMLQAQIARFPRIEEFENLHLLLSDFSRRAANEGKKQSSRKVESPRKVAQAPKLANQPVPEGVTVGQLVVLAQESARTGELAFARECWLAASQKTFPGDSRDDYVGEAQDLRARLTLHDELAKAWKAAPNTFAALGIDALDAAGWSENGRYAEWNEITLESYARVGLRIDLSKLARRGILCEALRSSVPAQRERAIAELASFAQQGLLEASEAANIVARARGGVGAAERFELYDGRWAARGALEAARLATEVTGLRRAFEHASAATRDAAWDALRTTGGDDAAVAALRERTRSALSALKKNSTLDQLAALAELRRELDDARKAALDAIFDEETYFYPYNPPTPPKTAGDYARASRNVDELVGLVREVWAKKKSVHVPKEFRAALEEYAWCVHASSEHELEVEAVPAYVMGLALDCETLELDSFAWDTAEAAELAYSRSVEARNEALWEALERKPDGVEPAALPDHAEREQVRVTNAYRRMLGRRSVAWNPRIQAAAQGHSDYMANTGDFGHFEKDPARHGPGERMKLAGYTAGVSENCSMGGGDPKSAHDGWCHSSGHHRNLLMPEHREMASGVAGFYWTQNFGVGTAFVAELGAR